jgi:hypothetical protein
MVMPAMRLRPRRFADQNIGCGPAHPCALLLFLLLGATAVRGQNAPSMSAERARLAEITGDSTWRDSVRPRRLADALPFGNRIPGLARSGAFVVPFEVRATWNSALPYSLNDGALWAGRGLSFSGSAGVGAERRVRGAIVRASIAPALLYSQNLPFEVFASTVPGRSPYANPFFGPNQSIDLPMRFGDLYLLRVDPGRSALSVTTSRVEAGVTTANDWWGPAIRNPLLMSNTAPGIPRWYVQTARPLRTRIGSVSAKLISGTLTRSRFFAVSSDEYRTLSGVLVNFEPAFDTTLTLSFGRAVYAPIGRDASPFAQTLARSFDALFRWEYLAQTQRSDQIYSVMGRWIFPSAGFEVYGEWAHMDLPRRISDLVLYPDEEAGFTVGFQWAIQRRAHDYLRLQSEVSDLEQTASVVDRPLRDFYTGGGSPLGYTERGQPIGAGIGPGGSSQWIAVDYLARRWQGGVFVGRIRWQNDALYRQPAPNFWRHDYTLLSGIRGGWRAPLTDLSLELTAARRYNYLFQNGFSNPGGYRTVDVKNLTLALVATPR